MSQGLLTIATQRPLGVPISCDKKEPQTKCCGSLKLLSTSPWDEKAVPTVPRANKAGWKTKRKQQYIMVIAGAPVN
jgi:hypothetical protein